MATFNISSNLNFDSASLLTAVNQDTFICQDGFTLTINSDSRWGQNACVLNDIQISGGRCLIDGRDTWWIPFDASTGNVPALGTVGTNDVTVGGTPVGEFLGVFTALGVSPSAAGGAMPTTGFIKLRRKVATINDNDVLTFTGGATATVNSTTGGTVGWLNVVLREGTGTSGILVSNSGTLETRGDWFYLANTNGTNDQTIQYYVADVCPAIQIETSPGSNVYEWWVNAGTTRWGQNNRAATDTRGKVFACSSSGVITLARTAGAITNGFLPPSGCKVRVPNVHISGANSTNYALNVINATVTSRTLLQVTATGGGNMNLNYVTGAFYLVATNARSVVAYDTSWFDAATITRPGSAVVFDECASGVFDVEATNSNLYIIGSAYGTTITNSTFLKYTSNAVTLAACRIEFSTGITVTGSRFMVFGNTTAATLTRASANAVTLVINNSSNITITNCILVGARLLITTSNAATITNTQYADTLENATTTTTNPAYVVDFTSVTNSTIDNCSILGSLTNVHPRGGIVRFQTGCTGNIVQNIGTAASPFPGGTVNACLYIFLALGDCVNNIIRRCYADNVSTAAFDVTTAGMNSNQYINVWGDAADASQTITNNNTVFRGLRASAFAIQPYVVDTYWLDTWTSTTAGRLYLFPGQFYTSATLNNQITINAGSPNFSNSNTTTSGLRCVTGDQVTYEMPYFLLGATALTNTNPTVLVADTGSFTKEYQIDTGSGWNGVWKSLTGANLSAETITSSTGFKLKIRLTCTSTGNVGGLYVHLTTTSTDQRTQYPLPGFNVTLTGLISGSEVRAYVGTDPSTSTELGGTESSGTSFTFSQNQGGNDGYIRVFALGYQDLYLPITYSNSAVTIPVFQTRDRQYLNP